MGGNRSWFMALVVVVAVTALVIALLDRQMKPAPLQDAFRQAAAQQQ